MRRAQLIQCAISVYADNGIDHSNHTQVAEAAGISLPTVINYFPTHDELRIAVVDEVARFLTEDVIAPSLGADMPADDLVERVLLAFAESIHTYPDYSRVWLDWGAAIRGPTWVRYLEFNLKAKRAISAIVERGQIEGSIKRSISPDIAGDIIVGAGHLVARMIFGAAPESAVHEAIKTLIDNLIREVPRT